MIEKIHESSLLLFVFLFRPNSQINCKIILFDTGYLDDENLTPFLHCRHIPTTQGMSNIGCVQLVFLETWTKNLDQSKAEISNVTSSL